MGALGAEVELLCRVSGVTNSGLCLDEILAAVIGETAQAIGCVECQVYLTAGRTGELVLRASLAPPGREPGSAGAGPAGALLSADLVSGGEKIGVLQARRPGSPEPSRWESALLVFVGEQLGGAVARRRQADQAEELQRQLETRKQVERAKGILQQRLGLSEEEAYLRLRNESRRMRKPMRELAEAIILSENLSRGGAGGAGEAEMGANFPPRAASNQT